MAAFLVGVSSDGAVTSGALASTSCPQPLEFGRAAGEVGCCDLRLKRSQLRRLRSGKKRKKQTRNIPLCHVETKVTGR